MSNIFSEYTSLQWAFFFFFYCFVGWIWECSYCSVRAKKFINRGFMRGPVIPIYGSGAVTLLVAAAPFKDNLILTFLSGMVLASILEYCTGAAMEAIFKVKYWDYSSDKFNLNGHICLYASIGWGVATILMTRFVHKPVVRFADAIPQKVMQCIVMVIAILFIIDYTLSFKAAWDIRNMLIKMEALKEDALRIHKRIDVLIAFAEEDAENFIERSQEKLEDKIRSIETRVSAAKEKFDLSDEIIEELSEIRMRSMVMKGKMEQMMSGKDFLKRSVIRDNPLMVSRKFRTSLEELKIHLTKK